MPETKRLFATQPTVFAICRRRAHSISPSLTFEFEDLLLPTPRSQFRSLRVFPKRRFLLAPLVIPSPLCCPRSGSSAPPAALKAEPMSFLGAQLHGSALKHGQVVTIFRIRTAQTVCIPDSNPNGPKKDCRCLAGNEGMTPINHPLWFPSRGILGLFPPSLPIARKGTT